MVRDLDKLLELNPRVSFPFLYFLSLFFTLRIFPSDFSCCMFLFVLVYAVLISAEGLLCLIHGHPITERIFLFVLIFNTFFLC